VADDDCACIDNDGDGYGETATPACPYPQWDCDDDPSDDPPECATCNCGKPRCAPCARCINPGEYEGPLGDPTCFDGLDNDCDGRLDDPDDRGCQQLDWSIPSQADASEYGPDLPLKSRTSNLLAIVLLAMGMILFLKFVHRKER
jgi:hypothetical protein